MSHYRAVMATTVDCEGCKYDSEDECKADFCILFENKFQSNKRFHGHDETDYLSEILKRVKYE